MPHCYRVLRRRLHHQPQSARVWLLSSDWKLRSLGILTSLGGFCCRSCGRYEKLFPVPVSLLSSWQLFLGAPMCCYQALSSSSSSVAFRWQSGHHPVLVVSRCLGPHCRFRSINSTTFGDVGVVEVVCEAIGIYGGMSLKHRIVLCSSS